MSLPVSTPPKDNKYILFVDDDEDDFHLLRDLFKESGRDVELQWAKDGEEALDRLFRRPPYQNAERPLLIMLDLNMPKLNGSEVLRQIRADEALRHVPVVVMTNSMNKEEALNAYRLGVNSFVRKPSGYTELRDFTRTFCSYWFDYSTLL